MAATASRLPGSPWRQLALTLVCLLAVLPGIFTLPPVDRDESRYVQATRQMLATGDYVDIRFQDEHRYKKPVGIYWLQSLTVTMTGHGADAPVWAFRLASTLGAVIAVLAISGLGGYLFGPLVAWGAGLMLIGLFGLGFEARMAKTDAVLLAVTIIAQAALARFYVGARRGEPVERAWWWIFWLAVGAGLLVKGPITPTVVAVTCLALVIFDRDRAWLRQFRPLRGLLVLVLVALPWFIAITWRSGLDFWAESVGKDLLSKVASGQESHGFPPGYYTLTYSLYMWPFGLLALVGGLKVISRFRDPRCLFLLAWYVPFWIVLELTPTKLPHYMLPVYPAIILAGAWAFLTEEGRAVALSRWQVWLTWLGAFGLLVVTLVFAGACLAGSPVLLEGRMDWWGVPAALLALAAAWLASGWGVPRMVPLGRLAVATAVAAVFTGLFTGRVVPAFTPIWLSPTIAQAFEANRPCPTSRLASVGYHEPSLVFLAGTETELTDVAGAARHLASADGCGIALVPESERGQVEAMMPAGTRLESVATISGINYSKGEELDLVLLRPVR